MVEFQAVKWIEPLQSRGDTTHLWSKIDHTTWDYRCNQHSVKSVRKCKLNWKAASSPRLRLLGAIKLTACKGSSVFTTSAISPSPHFQQSAYFCAGEENGSLFFHVQTRLRSPRQKLTLYHNCFSVLFMSEGPTGQNFCKPKITFISFLGFLDKDYQSWFSLEKYTTGVLEVPGATFLTPPSQIITLLRGDSAHSSRCFAPLRYLLVFANTFKLLPAFKFAKA